MIYLTNSFSLAALGGARKIVQFQPITRRMVMQVLEDNPDFVPFIKNEDIARVFTSELKTVVQFEKHKKGFSLEFGDTMLVGQLQGILPMGSRELPKGIGLQWWMVNVANI